MRSQRYLRAAVVVVALAGLGAQEQARAPVAALPTQPASTPTYRLLQLVSAGNLEQAINEAAAHGYRFLMLQPTAGAPGVTVLMKRLEPGAGLYQYKLLMAEPGKDRLQRALNQFASAGFRLVADSLRFAPVDTRGSELLLWPATSAGTKNQPMTHVAVLEKTPGASAAYDYRVSSALRHSAAQKDLEEITRQGFMPVVPTMELSESTAMALLAVPARLPHFVLVFEKNASDPASESAHGQYAYLKIGERLFSGDPLTELTADVPSGAFTAEARASEAEKKSEPSQEPGTPSGGDDDRPRLPTAAIAGSRVLSLTHFVYSDAVWLLAEKHPPKPPSYRLLMLADSSRLEDALNRAAREGFSLLPGGVVDTGLKLDPIKGEVRDRKHSRQLLAILKRDGAPSQCRYRILHSDDALVLLRQMNDAAAQGYEAVYMWETYAVMETASPDSAGRSGS